MAYAVAIGLQLEDRILYLTRTGHDVQATGVTTLVGGCRGNIAVGNPTAAFCSKLC